MVRLHALIVFLLFSFSAQAGTSLKFNSMPISEVADVFFRSMIKKDYVLSPDLITDQRLITVNISDIPESKLISRLTEVLNSQGIAYALKNDVYYLDLLKAQLPAIQNQNTVSTSESQTDNKTLSDTLENKPLFTHTIRFALPADFQPLFVALGVIPSFSESGRFIYYRADNQTNEILTNLLQQIDQPNQQLLVQAHLYEFTKSNTETTAFSAALNLLKSKLKINLSALTQANNMVLNLTDLQAVFSAISTDSRFSVVSSPTLRLTNGKTSKFNVGTETPVLGAIVTSGTGQSQQSVSYRQSGVIFEVKPTIYDDSIYLDLNQQVSNFVNTTSGVNNSPTLIKREIQTTLSVRDGEIVLLGGLADSKQSNDKTGVSWLPDFMKAKTNTDNKTDIFMVLQVTKI